MAEYRDPTPISPREPEYDKSKVSKEVANYTQQVREKKKGHDVREALARNSEIADIKAEDAVATSYDTKARQDGVENRFDDQIAGNTDIDEVIDARRPEGEEAYPTLRRRLDEEHQEVAAQLAKNEEKDFKNSMVNHKKTDKTIVWIDDDGYRGVYTKLKPLLEKYNIKMNSALITNREYNFPIDVPNPENPSNVSYIQYDEMVEMRDAGLCEFIGHTHGNIRLTDETDDAIYRDLKLNQSILKELGFEHRYFVYPFGAGAGVERVENVVRQIFDGAFSTIDDIVHFPMDQYAIERVALDKTTFAHVKGKIDEATENENLIVMYSHVEQYDGLDLDMMEDIISYALNQGYEFKFVSEMMQDFGNMADFGTTTIDKDGEIQSRDIGVYRYSHLDVGINEGRGSRPIETMVQGKMRIADGEESGMYNDLFMDTYPYGNYTTFFDSESGFDYQRAIDLTTNLDVIRKSNSETGEWESWSEVGRVTYSRKENQEPQNYERNKITVENIGLTRTEDYYLPARGTVVTTDHRQRTNSWEWLSQHYIPTREGRLKRPEMRRYATSETTWSPWYMNREVNRVLHRSWQDLTAPANGTRVATTEAERIYTDYAVEDVIKNNLPSGLIVQSAIHTEGKVETSVHNITNEPITFDLDLDLVLSYYE